MDVRHQFLGPEHYDGSAAFLFERKLQAVVRALAEHADAGQIREGIVSVLSSLAYMAKLFDDDPRDTEYSANIMIYRPFDRLDPERIRDFERRAWFTEREGTGASDWSGVLELAPELAVFLRGNDILLDPDRLPRMVLEIPRQEYRVDRNGKKAVLPGAPDAFCDKAYVFFHDAREMGTECRSQRALRHSVGERIERYFAEEAGQYVRSFVSIPLEPGDSAEMTDPLGIVNIHSSKPQMLRGRGVHLFVPLTAPHRLLIAGLLRKLLRKDA